MKRKKTDSCYLKFTRSSLDSLPRHHRTTGSQQVPHHGVRGPLGDVTHEYCHCWPRGNVSPRPSCVVGNCSRTPRWHASHGTSHGRPHPHPEPHWRTDTHGWSGSVPRHTPGLSICKQQNIISQRAGKIFQTSQTQRGAPVTVGRSGGDENWN